MKILVVGSGGREHALAWRLAQSGRVQVVYVAPGNGGTARERNVMNVPITRLETLAAFAERENVAFTVVGPEAPLAAGIVDLFRAKGLKIFGPTQAAAQLESSKDFAKAFMKRHGIPTADYRTFTDAAEARAYVTARGAPIVVKADGLAAGKGVVVARTEAEALAAVRDMLAGNLAFGEQRRLELIRAAASGAELLLLDEPAAGMNAEEIQDLDHRIRQLRDQGRTIVLIEHHMELVMEVCDRVAVLNFGRKIAEGTPAQIQQDAAVRAAYLGAEQPAAA
jgi:phosphoribosylamine--glycine ligase